MTCPSCHQPLTSLEITTQDNKPLEIKECLNCGGHFIAPLQANFISKNTAHNVDSIIPKTTNITLSSPVCPQCGQEMTSIKDNSLPNSVTVFHCPNNHGDFFPQGQLASFKKAQEAKFNFMTLWGIPLKSAFAVLLPVFIVITAVATIPTAIQLYNAGTENRVKAGEILTTPLVNPISSTQVIISFRTKSSAKTSITLTPYEGDTPDGTIPVSTTPKTNHLIELKNLSPETNYTYFITVEIDGRKTQSQPFNFATQ